MNNWDAAWRPFSQEDRTASLTEWMREDGEVRAAIADLEDREIDWSNDNSASDLAATILGG
jgi:hypothetical protein